MSFLLLAGIPLAVFAAVTALVSLAVWAAETLTARTGGTGSDVVTDPDRLSRRLFVSRVLPAATGVIAAAGVALPSFLAFEPRGLAEIPGWTLMALASAGLLWIGAGAGRAARDVWRASRLARAWSRGSRIVHISGADRPVHLVAGATPPVSLVGIVRPRVFVAEEVLGALTPSELAAVLEHEAAHRERRDNLRRVAIHLAPALPWPAAARQLEGRWEQAAEEACDARAHDALVMASALVKTARLVSASAGSGRLDLPAVAVHRGGPLFRRVRRLLAHRVAAPEPARRTWRALLAAAALAGAGCGLIATGWPQQAIEWLVRLP